MTSLGESIQKSKKRRKVKAESLKLMKEIKQKLGNLSQIVSKHPILLHSARTQTVLFYHLIYCRK
jgi:hypothetical protein